MSIDSINNHWRRRGINSLFEYLNIPFGDNVLCEQKPAAIENKTIDANKNTLLNFAGGGGSVPDATTTVKGKVELAEDNENAPSLVVQANDTRLSNSRSPLAHTHVKTDVTDFAHSHIKADISDFSHSHIKSDISDFAHTHVKADVTDFSHTHVKADISDFAHSHTEGDLPDATTTGQGVVELATNGENAANVVVQGNDSRLSDARSPLSHTHVKADVTDLVDATTTTKGIVELATDGESAANVVVQGNDARMSNSRAPNGSATGDLTGSYPNPSVANNAISNTKAADMAGFTVKAKPDTGSGDPTDLSMSTDTVLIRKSGNVVSDKIDTAQINNDQVTYGKIQNVVNDDRVLGRISGANGDIEELTGAQVRDLIPDGTTTAKGVIQLATDAESNSAEACASNDSRLSNTRTPTDGTVTTAKIVDDNVTYAKIQNVTDNRLLGRSAGSNGDVQEITIGSGLALSSGQLAATGGGTAKEDLVAAWDVSSTKTNIGTSYVDIYTQTGSEGKPFWIDFTNKTQYRIVLYWNKIGSGTQQVKFCDSANPTTNILHNFSNAVSNENDSGLQSLPAFATGRVEIKMMALSSTAGDDPVFESARIYLK
ncbi:MAG TPA: hypothetical protein VL854_06255 [Nitrososphaeraceae archaeon]|nr:hypothetical protein [Nitrososphaeraceae archaeon]